MSSDSTEKTKWCQLEGFVFDISQLIPTSLSFSDSLLVVWLSKDRAV